MSKFDYDSFKKASKDMDEQTKGVFNNHIIKLASDGAMWFSVQHGCWIQKRGGEIAVLKRN